jgi:vancomycin aglycone glucosyltransferase
MTEPANLDIVQTGAWLLHEERPLAAELEAFLGDGAPPAYITSAAFPCAPLRTSLRQASRPLARRAIAYWSRSAEPSWL